MINPKVISLIEIPWSGHLLQKNVSIIKEKILITPTPTIITQPTKTIG